MDEFGKAIVDYNKAIELAPEFALAYGNRGTADYHTGDYDKAIADCSKAIELNPHAAGPYAAGPYNDLGLAFNKKGNYDKAITSFKQALIIEPNNPELYYYLGTIYEKLSQKAVALSNYENASRLDPSGKVGGWSREAIQELGGGQSP